MLDCNQLKLSLKAKGRIPNKSSSESTKYLQCNVSDLLIITPGKIYVAANKMHVLLYNLHIVIMFMHIMPILSSTKG